MSAALAKAKEPLYKLPYATKVQFLQIYRRLLRETTYLPDPWAREYWRKYITKRFNSYHPHKPQNGQKLDPLAKVTARPIHSSTRATVLLDSSKSFFRTLCRANYGFPTALTVVLRHAYGRVGPRKYELLAPYRAHEPPADANSLEEVVAEKSKQEKKTGPEVPEALRAIAFAQKVHGRSIPSTSIRHVDAKIPEKNSWGRPMPLCRVRNMKRKHLNELEQMIMPPLPRTEWERLRDLAFGQKPRDCLRKRRPGHENNTWHREKYLVRPRSIPSARQMTYRSMRRMWERMFVQCPLIEKDSKGDWVVQWGELVNRAIVPELSEAEGGWQFEGLEDDTRGKGYWSEYNRKKVLQSKGIEV